MCKCGWIDIASARASAIEVYTCKPAVYTQAKTVLTFQIIGIVQGRLQVVNADYSKVVVYKCKCGWIDIASARASAIEV